MYHWNEIRTAAAVARTGTVSAAAQELGVHRATVTRHIDTLEGALSGKLFQRNRRGFLPTDLGQRLLQIADASDEQFEQLFRYAKRQGDVIEGDLLITSLAQMAEHLLPAIAEFGRQHPAVRTHFLASQDLARLEYGEAHVALRAGPKPQDPDNIVRSAGVMRVGLYAHRDYIAAHGKPDSETELAGHRLIGSDAPDPRAPFLRWMASHIPARDLVLVTNDVPTQAAAVQAGIGIGFLPEYAAQEDANLVEILPPRPEWNTHLWLVTHVDLSRTPKVRAFLDLMKSPRALWRFADTD